MATMSKDRVTVSSTKNQIRFECQKFLDKKKYKGGPIALGKFRVDVQLTLLKLSSIDSKLEKKMHEEAVKIIGRASQKVQEGLESLHKTIETQQKKEKQGDTKARDVADKELKAVNKIVTDAQLGLGGDLRKGIEALLKKEGVGAKATAVARNAFERLQFERDAFQAEAEPEIDDKAWGKLGKGELALTDKHPAIIQEIKLRTNLAKSLAPIIKSGEGDVDAAKKELAAYSSHGQTLTMLLSKSSDSIAAMVKQLDKDKKSIDKKVAQRLVKELGGLKSTTGSVIGLVKDGMALAKDVAGVMKSPDGASEAAQYKNDFADFVKGVATIKTHTKKSGGSAKIIDALSKTLTKKK